MPNETYEEFRERMLGSAYMIWHDGGPDTSLLSGLRGEEREYAFAMLLEGLQEGDYAAVQALRAFETMRALPYIQRMLPGASAQLRLELARFLNDYDPAADRDALAELVMQLVFTPATCLDAAIVLRYFPTTKVKEFLLETVAKSSEYFIRYHAANSLLHMAGSSLDAHPDVFQNLTGEAMTEDDVRRFTRATEQLRALLPG